MSQLSVEKSETLKKYCVKESKLEKKEKSEKNVRTQFLSNLPTTQQVPGLCKAILAV